jgi:phosphatidylinositol-3-phosphatase
MKAAVFVLITSLAWAASPSKHIIVIIGENSSYSQVVGASYMPYLNSLIRQGSLFTQMYANQHGSFPARQWIYSGRTIEQSAAAAGTPFPTCGSYYSLLPEDNLVRHLLRIGRTWRSYNDQMPYSGYQSTSYGWYRKGHNGLTWWTDACGSDKYWSKPGSGLAADLQNHKLANFTDIDGSEIEDGHYDSYGSASDRAGALRNFDIYLKKYIPLILALPEFQPGGDGQLWITFDEGSLQPWTDNTNGGGHIFTLVIGPHIKKTFRSSVFHRQQDMLKTWCLSLGCLTPFPGYSNTSISMSEIYK